MALFEIVDPHGGPPPPGPWQTRPAPAASFSAGAAPEAQSTLWRVDLPADPAAAWAELRQAEAGLSRQEAAVADAPARLRRLAARGNAASFSAAPAADSEARLLGLVGELRGARAASFSLAGGAASELPAIEARFRAFTQQVQDAVVHFAVVETSQDRRLLARTSVGWAGDMRSLLADRLPPEQAALHRRSLGLARRSRAALLRSFAAVMRGATIVALMVSSPLGAATALPAAWSFVNDLLREERARA